MAFIDLADLIIDGFVAFVVTVGMVVCWIVIVATGKERGR